MHGTKRHPKFHKALSPDTKKHPKSHWPEWVIGKTMMEKAMKSIGTCRKVSSIAVGACIRIAS